MSETLSDRLRAWSRDLALGRKCIGADQDVREAADTIDALTEVVTDLLRTCQPAVPTLQAADARRRAERLRATATQEPVNE